MLLIYACLTGLSAIILVKLSSREREREKKKLIDEKKIPNPVLVSFEARPLVRTSKQSFKKMPSSPYFLFFFFFFFFFLFYFIFFFFYYTYTLTWI